MLLALAVTNTIVTLVFNPWARPAERDRAPSIVQDVIVVALIGGVAYAVFRGEHRRAVDRRGGRARAGPAGPARQSVRGPRDPDRAAVSRRPLDLAGELRGPRGRGHLARDEDPHEGRQPRDHSEQHRRPRGDHQLLGADRADAAVGRGRRDVRGAAQRGPRRAHGGHGAACRSVLHDPAPDVMHGGLRRRRRSSTARGSGSTTSQHDERIRHEVRTRDLLRVPSPRDRDPVADSGRVRAPRDRPRSRRRDGRSWPRRSRRFRSSRRCQPTRTTRSPRSASERLFADGEAIVREGEAGGSMFIVRRGRVAVTRRRRSSRGRGHRGRRVLRRDVAAHGRSADGDGHRARRLHRARDHRRRVPGLRAEPAGGHRSSGRSGGRAATDARSVARRGNAARGRAQVARASHARRSSG